MATTCDVWVFGEIGTLLVAPPASPIPVHIRRRNLVSMMNRSVPRPYALWCNCFDQWTRVAYMFCPRFCRWSSHRTYEPCTSRFSSGLILCRRKHVRPSLNRKIFFWYKSCPGWCSCRLRWGSERVRPRGSRDEGSVREKRDESVEIDESGYKTRWRKGLSKRLPPGQWFLPRRRSLNSHDTTENNEKKRGAARSRKHKSNSKKKGELNRTKA